MSDFFQNPSPAAHIVPQDNAPLSKDQKAFNTLIKKIEAKRARLAEWEFIIPLFHQKYASDLHPLYEQETDLERQLAQALDLAHDKKGLTKIQRDKISSVIVDLTLDVLEEKEEEEIKALYNKHSSVDYDTEEDAKAQFLKSLIEGITGVELGDDVDIRSPEDVLRKIDAQFETGHTTAQERETTRKKSATTLAREARLAAEEKQLSQSIREVYRKLASSLHPDREPDLAERVRKTELMQHVNEAYKKGNLLRLLELQLQLEHIDQAHLASIGPEQLKHYLKILKGQLNDLEMEVFHVEDEFGRQFGMPGFKRQDPKRVMPLLNEQIAACEVTIRKLKEQLEFVGDQARLKAWLKTIDIRQQPLRGFDMPF